MAPPKNGQLKKPSAKPPSLTGSQKRGLKPKGFWHNMVSWKDVTPVNSAELLMGSDEGGFMSLEEVDGDAYYEGEAEIKQLGTHSVSGVDEKKKKKQQKEKKVQSVGDKRKNVSDLVNEESLTLDVNEKKVKKRKKKKGGEKEMPIQTDELRSTSQNEEEDAGAPSLTHANSGDEASVELKGQAQFLQNSGGKKLTKNQKGKKKKLKRKNSTTQSAVVSEPLEEKKSPVENRDVPQSEVDMSAWADMRLHPLLEKALAAMGFLEPTHIQRACIPAAAHQGKDVVGAAETGSGKTLAFGLPILQRLLEEQDKNARSSDLAEPSEASKEGNVKARKGSPLKALILTPTRELALQVSDHLKSAAQFTSLRVVPVVGGVAPQKQQRLLRIGPEIVVATPGRLWELMSGGEQQLLDLSMLSFFVLDEADRMVEKGHFQELQSIIDALPANHRRLPRGSEPPDAPEGQQKKTKKRQTMVFSATLSLPPGFRNKLKKGVSALARSPGPAPRHGAAPDSVAALIEATAGGNGGAGLAVVDLTTAGVMAAGLSESCVECVEEEKDCLLYYLLRLHGHGRSLLFCTSIAAVRRLASLLLLLQLPAWPLHAQMQQRQRFKSLDRFRASTDGILIATDVAARGLDIPGVRSVLHYQMPHEAEVYVHRCGRTARAGEAGVSIALVAPSDRIKYSTLMRALKKGSGLQPFPVVTAYLPQIKKCVQLASKVDSLVHRNSKKKAEQSWIERNASELELSVDEGMLDRRRLGEEEEEEGKGAGKGFKSPGAKRAMAALQTLKNELNKRLGDGVKPKAFSGNFFAGNGISSETAQQLKYLKDSRQASKPKKASLLQDATASRKSRFLVIGHNTTDALAALQRAAGRPGVA